jgi:tetratricopeptide (TPR) repeat protein
MRDSLSFCFMLLSGSFFSGILSSSTPHIYDNSVNVCLEHLLNDPAACDSFTLSEGDFLPEFQEYGYAEIHFDPTLLSRVAFFTHLIPVDERKTCDFKTCYKCGQPVIRGSYEVFCDGEITGTSLGHRCQCLTDWYEVDYDLSDAIDDRMDDQEPNDDSEELEQLLKDSHALEEVSRHNREIAHTHWSPCPNPTIENSYFNARNEHCFSFFEQFIKYCAANPSCQCYWPQLCPQAYSISNFAYITIEQLVDNPRSSLSDLVVSMKNYPYFPTSAEVTEALLTHAFFYSHYHQICIDLCHFTDQSGSQYSSATLDKIYNILFTLQPHFLETYNECLQKHPHPKIYYERGMTYMHLGDAAASLDDIQKLIADTTDQEKEELFSSDLYFQEGSAYAELGLYDRAVEALSRAIHINPNNKEAYFERAAAYFELGEFDISLQDFLQSGYRSKSLNLNLNNKVAFSLGLSKGIIRGGARSIGDFVPSCLSTVHGLGRGLWAFAQQPIQVSYDLIQALESCIDFLKTNTSAEILKTVIPELRELVENWDNFGDFERGEKAGYILGRYTVDIFVGAGVAKGMRALRDLRKANNLLTFEIMALNDRNKAAILGQAAEMRALRSTYFSKIEIEMGKQAKHLPGRKNFIIGNSEWLYPDPKKKIRDLAGTGQKIKGGPGYPGYKERVDCGEIIGIYVNKETNERLPTSMAIIHYSKKGAHIVPARPR